MWEYNTNVIINCSNFLDNVRESKQIRVNLNKCIGKTDVVCIFLSGLGDYIIVKIIIIRLPFDNWDLRINIKKVNVLDFLLFTTI